MISEPAKHRFVRRISGNAVYYSDGGTSILASLEKAAKMTVLTSRSHCEYWYTRLLLDGWYVATVKVTGDDVEIFARQCSSPNEIAEVMAGIDLISYKEHRSQ